jgi:hypothetical protein
MCGLLLVVVVAVADNVLTLLLLAMGRRTVAKCCARVPARVGMGGDSRSTGRRDLETAASGVIKISGSRKDKDGCFL